MTSATRTAAHYDVAPMSPGLLALALTTAEDSAARRALLADSGLARAQLPDEVLTHLVRRELPDYADWAASSERARDGS